MIATLAGFLAGFIHVLAGPDHLAAIAPLAAKHPRNSWIAGLRWKVGHASGVCLVGIMTLLLRGLIPVELVSKSGDRLIGVMLIAIGAWALRKGLRIHAHAAHMHAALAVGTLHGLRCLHLQRQPHICSLSRCLQWQPILELRFEFRL